jgi:carbon storage regulator CsrA
MRLSKANEHAINESIEALGGCAMLVLSRKTGEAIVIGRTVVVRVVRLSRERAVLAIEAPKPVRVNREEVLQAEGGLRQTEPCGKSYNFPAEPGGGDAKYVSL